MGTGEMHTAFWSENLGAETKIILEQIFGKYDGKLWT
jgi:hypothetical protein